MKADWDDAQNRLKASSGAGNVGKWLTASLIGTSITTGLLYLAGAKIPFLQNSAPVSMTEQPRDDYSPLPPFEEQDPDQPPTEEMF